MPSSFFKGLTVSILYPIPDFPKDWTRTKLEQWITAQGGKFEVKFTIRTTHIVCTHETWLKKSPGIQQALECGRKVWIVSPNWLQDCLTETRKAREGPYSWAKIGRGKVVKRTEAEAGEEGEEPLIKSTAGLMTQVFHDSADRFVDPADKRQIEQDALMAKRVEEEKERQREREARNAQAAAVFRRGAKRARNEIFSDNHHIYSDATGFKYDIQLTKVDTAHNRNERITLTIYETNSVPATYATNLYHAGTAKSSSHATIAVLGSNFLTAFRVFKKVFQEKTGVEWDKRIEAAIERAEKIKRARGPMVIDLEAGSARGSAGRGRPVSEREVEREAEQARLKEAREAREAELPFDQRKFEYHPPSYGPRGVLPEGAATASTNQMNGQQPGHKGKEKVMEQGNVETWLQDTSDANGDIAAEPAQDHSSSDFEDCILPMENARSDHSHADSVDFQAFMSGAAGPSGEASDDIFNLDTGYPFGETQVPEGEAIGSNTAGEGPSGQGRGHMTDLSQYEAAQDTRANDFDMGIDDADFDRIISDLAEGDCEVLPVGDGDKEVGAHFQDPETVQHPINYTQAADKVHQEMLSMLSKRKTESTEQAEEAPEAEGPTKKIKLTDSEAGADDLIADVEEYLVSPGQEQSQVLGTPRAVAENRDAEPGVQPEAEIAVNPTDQVASAVAARLDTQ